MIVHHPGISTYYTINIKDNKSVYQSKSSRRYLCSYSISINRYTCYICNSIREWELLLYIRIHCTEQCVKLKYELVSSVLRVLTWIQTPKPPASMALLSNVPYNNVWLSYWNWIPIKSTSSSSGRIIPGGTKCMGIPESVIAPNSQISNWAQQNIYQASDIKRISSQHASEAQQVI